MVSPPPIDRVAYLRLRWRARIATGSFLLVGVWLSYRMARLGASPFAVIPFLALAALGAAAWPVLRGMWARSFAARPVTLRLDPDSGELVDRAAATDDEPRRHQAFTGEVRPPRRW
ncbi:hypothetical protein DDP54_17305 [Cellulomonas sp. WB94]|uniref:hypothetical protein n=1 Tax=Cellulomonas sp. WB94 TaxID=2173174 RepID=UPI000D56B00B|nr:hypothetical protein [Cellulomonas sp. WB94]PVU81112.1 hypothetical protein DDP54_17305 [Cellulomonas sp. WB94]